MKPVADCSRTETTRPFADWETDWTTLVEAARRGDDDAFGEICNRMAEYLRLTASDIGGRLQAKFGASDIVQQTLLEARQGFAAFQGSSEGELRTWLARLVRHNLKDSAREFRQTEKRNLSREQTVSIDEIPDDCDEWQKQASSIVRQRETDDELQRAIAELSDRRRKIIELRHWHGLSFAEIGQQLTLSEVAARQLLARALEELRKKLATDHARQTIQPR